MLSINYNDFGLWKRGIVLWQDACIAVIWVVWWERNARIFYDKARNAESLWDSIFFPCFSLGFLFQGFQGSPPYCFTT